MVLQAAISVLCLTLVTATCYTYEAQDPPLYCDNQVTWSIADTLDPWTQSHRAFQLYHKMKEAYLAANDTSPSIDCLAIAQKFYCAYAFPYCDSDSEPSRGICTFLCDLYSSRCPADDYDFFCSTSESTRCSSSVYLLTSLWFYLSI